MYHNLQKIKGGFQCRGITPFHLLNYAVLNVRAQSCTAMIGWFCIEVTCRFTSPCMRFLSYIEIQRDYMTYTFVLVDICGCVHAHIIYSTQRHKVAHIGICFPAQRALLTHQIFPFMKWQVIRLSAATQDLPRSIICNIHGVNPKFLEIGKKKNEQQKNGDATFSKGAYYIGKMLWSKGYKELFELLRDHQKDLSGLEVDLYGSGEDSVEVQEAVKKLDLKVRVHPGRDHADPLFHE